jgi:hypothetical protein
MFLFILMFLCYASQDTHSANQEGYWILYFLIASNFVRINYRNRQSFYVFLYFWWVVYCWVHEFPISSYPVPEIISKSCRFTPEPSFFLSVISAFLIHSPLSPPPPPPPPPQYQVPNLLTIVCHIKMEMKISKLGLELLYLNFIMLLTLFNVSFSLYTYEWEVFVWNYKTKYFTDILGKCENIISFQLVLTVVQW